MQTGCGILAAFLDESYDFLDGTLDPGKTDKTFQFGKGRYFLGFLDFDVNITVRSM